MTSTPKVLALIATLAILARASPFPHWDELPQYDAIAFGSLSEDFKWKDVSAPQAREPARLSPDDNWNLIASQIEPTPELVYHDCGGNFECARLELPLNWNATGPDDVTYGMKYNMAIVRLPAQVAVTDPRYGGPVLVNPGGPGASGVEYALRHGQAIQVQIDAAFSYNSSTYVAPEKSAKYFDIIGFDPRGVNHSTPYHTCSSSTSELGMLAKSWGDLQWPGDFHSVFWNSSASRGQKCVWDPVNNPGTSPIANFSSSAMVARDLVEFVERHAEWGVKQSTGVPLNHAIKWTKGEEPILLHGASYGTLLGATLAAMQPHRVKRFYLDGVVDAVAQRVRDMLRKYEKAAEHLTLDDTAAFRAYLAQARIKGMMNELAYSPLKSWKRTAKQLADLEAGKFDTTSKQPNDMDRNVDSFIDPYDPDIDSRIADSLNDFWTEIVTANDQKTRSSYQQFATEQWREMHNVAPWRADTIATAYGGIFNWPIVPSWAFGDKHQVSSDVTANPILFASNLIDGVTSLKGAQRMRDAFKGSGLLIVDGEGHGTWSSPSLCAAKGVRHYFQTGELPDTSKHCLPAKRAFLGEKGPHTEKIEWYNLTWEEQVLFDAVDMPCPNGVHCPPVRRF
ncbi:hypothetical protein CKM354_000787700 [Cercospora kikuchii]|uniref:Peptidase S33 tripeptidyl aminopeptidase-like C-terminal domain-containing protein n=1 Tax=Cercospora kikuchii TaxID=84275 RepID=A0A9P3FER6_9PEZI|nr:uncharacterized protein CKM354_000787700 [Cercospora kikuchii]GIZ44686.1 hypothetical protein CKM354_000787700 [Cercospora kikuchii]